MGDVAVRVEKLSKRYEIGSVRRRYDTLRDQIAGSLKAVVTRNGETRAGRSFIWALRDVSFEIKHGEVTGIIGRNGAGKSTLLKILSRITEPTAGYAEIHGRVGSLLEVGTGFHPELTGRENIYLNGAILGMKKAEIARNFDAIVAFAEVEKFIDTPVKRYSSGMYVRLAFAVAAHLEPEVLIVDEVLAVGDAAFQNKCLGKMRDVAREGRTVIFVSHNVGAISSLTGKCIYLRDGQMKAFAKTAAILEKYLSENLKSKSDHNDLAFFRREAVPDSPVRVTRVAVNGVAHDLAVLEQGEAFIVGIELQVIKPIRGANLTLVLKNVQGDRIAVFFSWDQGFSLFLSPGVHAVEIKVDELPLPFGQYLGDIGINQSTDTRAYEVIVDLPLFKVVNRGEIVHWLDRPWGSVHWKKVEWNLSGSQAPQPHAPE